jgi:hypothetical protein
LPTKKKGFKLTVRNKISLSRVGIPSYIKSMKEKKSEAIDSNSMKHMKPFPILGRTLNVFIDCEIYDKSNKKMKKTLKVL